MAQLHDFTKKWVRKLLAGGTGRRTRLHDEKGNLASTRRILCNGSRAALSNLIRAVTGSRPKLPWISYDAIAEIKQRITKDWRVLEFGSGMSTLWLSRHAAFVASVEDNALWYAHVHRLLHIHKLDNAVHQLQTRSESYVSFPNDDVLGFDFILIDGSFRSACLHNALPRLRPGGAIYLDNSDKDSTVEGGDMRAAEAILRAFASKRGAKLKAFTDFAPAQFFAQEGILMTLHNDVVEPQ